jgi:hypothetical protein
MTRHLNVTLALRNMPAYHNVLRGLGRRQRMAAILLWLLGIPIPIIIILFLLHVI